MSKYFFDCEFIEGFKKPLFGKRRHFIDLISIGIVAEDGREYYAISNEYNYNNADDLVKENVIDRMYIDTVHVDRRNLCDATNFHKEYGKSNKIIAEDIALFCYPDIAPNFSHAKEEFLIRSKKYGWNTKHPEFYAYYADYDWVLFCSLFGRMIDLPKGFPMYCKDLQQYKEDVADKILSQGIGTHSAGDKWYPDNMAHAKEWVESHPFYPKQENEHNALDDAKWNKRLFDFIRYMRINY